MKRWPAEWVWHSLGEGVYPDDQATTDLASFYENDAKSDNGFRKRRRRRLRNRLRRRRRARQLRARRMV
jgi:hypothetical protein